MEAILLKYDGRCRWLNKKVLNNIFPQMIKAAADPEQKTMYLIEDWISNDNGKVGVDQNWLASIGVPVVKTYNDLPKEQDFAVVNTGYDSIVDEEKKLLAAGIEIIDLPCPYIRKIRREFEKKDNSYQCVLLCESNHIIIKNYKSIFPEDMILVQMVNYAERILEQQNGKPFKLIPYVTFLPSHVKNISDFIQKQFPHRDNLTLDMSCMWVKSPVSPIVEISKMTPDQLENVQDALLISSPGSINKSVISLVETLEQKGLNVVLISSLNEYLDYERKHHSNKVLIVRSPVPNKAEKPIIKYLSQGS